MVVIMAVFVCLCFSSFISIPLRIILILCDMDGDIMEWDGMCYVSMYYCQKGIIGTEIRTCSKTGGEGKEFRVRQELKTSPCSNILPPLLKCSRYLSYLVRIARIHRSLNLVIGYRGGCARLHKKKPGTRKSAAQGFKLGHGPYSLDENEKGQGAPDAEI
jgi:hypothetical protein